jgi:hypothetical protein
MDFCISFKSVRGSTVSTITRIYAGRSGVQILGGARELYSPDICYRTVSQNKLFLQCERSHYKHIKMRKIFDL